MRITNLLLARFIELKAQQRGIETEIELIKRLIIEQKGAQTADYVAVVKEMVRHQAATLKEFERKFGPDWLLKNKLLNTIQYKQVEVLVRPKREQGLEKEE